MSNIVTAIDSLSQSTEDVFQSSSPTLYCDVKNNGNNKINKRLPLWHEHARIVPLLICLCWNSMSLVISTPKWLVLAQNTRQWSDVWKSQWSGKTPIFPIPYILDILCIAWFMLLTVSFFSSSNWTSTHVRSPLSSSCTPSSLQKSLVWVWWPDVAREAPQLDCAAFGPKQSECSLHL